MVRVAEKFEFEGRLLTIEQWAVERGIKRHTLYYRLKQLGWTIDRALAAPTRYEEHGGRRASEYGIWNQMIQRCTNPKNKRWLRYGGRGIQVCKRWAISFAAFFEDVGKRPSKRHQLDRKNGDGHYEPDNVGWVLPKKQQRHRRDSRYLKFKGERLTVAEWAERTGIPAFTLYQRVSKLGWPANKALTTPVRKLRKRKK